jgi:hypothetical protein
MKKYLNNKKISFKSAGIRWLAIVIASMGMLSSATAFTIFTPFTGTSVSGWTINGGATLTAATGVDPAGQGWLRLTENQQDQSATATYDTAFPSAGGLQITFQYATWGKTGGNGADGIVMYLIDGSVTSPTIGAYGGSLGYSSNTSTWGTAPGVTKGYVGIGFDEFGNFSFDEYGGGCTVPCGFNKNYVAVRGAGNLLDDASSANTPLNEFSLLASVPVTAIETGATDRGNIATVRITITPAPDPTITVERDTGSGYATIINALSLAGNGAVPATFKLGFSSSTGGENNFHEVRMLTIQDLKTASGVVDPVPVPVFDRYGMAALLTVLAAAFIYTALRRLKR